MNALRYLLLVVGLAASVSVHAGGSGDGGRESPFTLGGGAGALGMGGAFTALAHDANAVFYNPAGLPWLEYQEISGMHVTLFEGTLYDVGSWGAPVVGVGGFGAAFMRIGTGDIVRRADFVNEGTFNYTTWQFLLGYGRKFGSHLSLGGTLKIVNQALDDRSDYGLGMDFGMKARLYRGLMLGLALRNLAPPELTLDATSDKLPFAAIAGLAVQQLHVSSFMTATLAADLEKTEGIPHVYHAGVELEFRRALSLRAGYDRDNFSCGAGLTVGRVKVDYAYKILDFIEDSHRFSLTLLIGPSVTSQLERRAREAHQLGTRMLEDERARQLTSFRTKADDFYRRLILDSALTYYQRALAFDEKNQEIIGTIAAIDNIQRIKAEEEARIRSAQQELEQTVRVYFDQAAFLYSRKYFPASLDLIGLIFESDPDNADAKALKRKVDSAMAADIASARDLCLAAEREGRLLEAVEACNRVLELAPSDSVARQAKQRISTRMDLTQQLKLGIDLFNQNRLAEARRQFEAVLKINPQEPVAREYLEKMQVTLPQETTLEDIQNDRDIWPIYLEGLRLMRNKEYQKAIDAWQRVLQKYPNNSNAIENIRQARLRMES